MNKHKRLLSFLLAVVMILGMFPLTASAEDETHTHCEVCDSHEHTTENHVDVPEVCEICKGENGKHSTGCPTLCECETAPAEGEAHAVGCPLYTPVNAATLNLGDDATGDTTTDTTGTTTGTTAAATTQGTTAATTVATTTATTAATTVATTAATTEATTEATTAPTTKPTDETTAPTTKPTDATTAPTTAPTTQPAEVTTAPTEEVLCEKCEATKAEDGTVVHAEDCETLCNCTPVDGKHQAYCKLYTMCEVCGVDPCVCELEAIYLMKGASIYKDYKDASETPKVIDKWNTEISIKETITAEDGTIWYHFAYTSFWAELFNGYKYVRMDDTTEYECSCNSADGIHGENCALYVEEVIEEESNEEEDPIEIPELEESVFAVEISGGAGLEFEVVSPEVAYALEYATPWSSSKKYPWTGIYDITADTSTQVTVTNMPSFTSETIEVRHYLDDAEAVSGAISSGKARYLEVDDYFVPYFAEEIAALQTVDSSRSNTICYTLISSEDGGVEIIGLEGGEKAISFYADSYSYYGISIVFEPASTYLNAAAPAQAEEPQRSTFSLRASKVDNPGIETSKTVIFDEDTKEYRLQLESYVTGATISSEISTTKATDFIISIDISHSMPPCINCGAGGVDATGTGLHNNVSKCKVYAPDLDKTKTYYLDDDETEAVKYCESCQGWFLEAHFTVDIYGRHGSTSDVRYYSRETSNDTDRTVSTGVGNQQFYEEIEGSRVPVYSLDEGFSTGKMYYADADVTHTGAAYVIEYCTECERWISGGHCSGGNSYTGTFYEQQEDGTRVKVDKATLDYEKTYYKSSKVDETGAKYELHFCSDCQKWYYNYQDHARDCSKGTVEIPYAIAEYYNTKVDQFYKSCVSRMQAAKEAAAAFVAAVKEKSKGADGIAGTEDDVPHRVAVIGFGGNGTGDAKVGVADYQTISGRAKNKYTSTGIYSLYEDKTDEGFGYYNSTNSYNNFESYHLIKNDTTLAASCYANALRDVTDSTEYAVLEEGIRELNYNYGTYINYASIMAEQIFEATYQEDEQDGISRNRVAVFFTDGQPDGDGTGTYDLANDSIQPAYRMKNNENYKATVYSVGIFANANASKIWSLTSNASQDEYMHLLSSNYPTAWSGEGSEGAWGTPKVRDVGTTNSRKVLITDVNPSLLTTDADGNTIVDTSKGGYYLTANNASSLVNAFENIANENTTGGANESAKKLDEKTVLQDIVSENFTIDIGESSAREIKVWTETYTGDDEDGNKLWSKDETVVEGITFNADTANNVVRVTGFNYSDNYVGTNTASDGSVTYRGKKIVVEIPIAVPDSNMGGIAMETNNFTNSGIFYNSEMQEQFDLPLVDIPRKITISKEVIGGSTSAFNYELSYEPFRDYAAEGNDGSSGNYLYTDEADPEDQMGITSMTITADNPATSEVVEGKRTVENMMPGTDIRITEQNVANYMVAVSLDGGNTWKDLDGNIWSEASEEPEEPGESEEPEVPEGSEGEEGNDGEEETPEEPEESEELEVPCTLVMDNDGNCTVTISGWEWPSGMDIVFRNTLKVVDLTINKKIEGETNPDQSFLFQIDGEDVSIPVVIPAEDFVDGTASVTIKGLKVGMYTVTEDSGWSWRYTLNSVEADAKTETTYKKVNNGIQIIMDHEGSTVTFTNDRTDNQWLDGESHAANIFKSLSETTE